MNIFKRLKWFKKQIRWNYKYKKGTWDFMSKENLRYETIVNQIQKTAIVNPSVLDLGCGFGALNDHLSASDYGYFLGIDFSSNAIQRAKDHNYTNANFLVADIHHFVPNQNFDVIIFNEVLYYLEDQMAIVEKFAHYFNSKGYFIFSFFGGREDLVIELEKKYQLIQKEVVTQENISWSVCLYKAK
jgi:2-polyprenyl-3-methyl-5-hydroxy-6-metoxy-1,4-benzoquinol methylase